MGNTASECRLGLVQNSNFAADLANFGFFCVSGSRTCVPVGFVLYETAVSHSRTEADIIYLEAGPRSEGIHVLTLWNLVIEVLDFQVEKNPMRHLNNNINPKKSPTSEMPIIGGA